MFGVDDGHDRGPVADTARPPCDLLDVQDGVATLNELGIGHFAHAVVGAQDQVRHSDVEAAMQPCVSAPDRVNPAERHREPADRFPVQVVVELAVVVAMQ